MESVLGAALPNKSDPCWTALVTSGTTKPLKLLALQFTLMRMNIRVRMDPSPTSVAKNVDELYPHLLATQFADLDKFYDSGDVSGDGWNWTLQGHANDYTDKSVPVSYGNGGFTFDWNGSPRNLNVSLPEFGPPTLAGERTTLRTIEDLLGARPLGMNDANAAQMDDVFSRVAQLGPYNAVIPGDLCRPPIDPGLVPDCSNAKVAQTKPVVERHSPAWWAAQTRGFDFRGPDRINSRKFNAVLWAGQMRAAPVYPR